jgi:hypothetical protein
MKMLDYSSSVEDPQESWLWDSNDEDSGLPLNGLELGDQWTQGKMVNYLEVRNITQSQRDFEQNWKDSFFQKVLLKKKKKTMGELKSKKRNKRRVIKKKKTKSKPKPNTKNSKISKNLKLNVFYKKKKPNKFTYINFKQNQTKKRFRCYPYDSQVLQFDKMSLKNKLIGKEMDDDSQTDDEVQKDAISFLYKHLKSGLERALSPDPREVSSEED